ncbi:Flp pilus assembly protein CpaB [Sinomonas notoginsengisoli]|uniref:Flp pilus assembly protein CpaB n=1 Tax=Sinomonas notoginsengisoli TaxID=1457311 RepID=UPI001F3FCCDD|nr:RcpC/CpaB family pilus assembly protein [Sinomonas notoginsengisoli]
MAALIVAIIGTALLLTYVNSADQRAYASTETEMVYVVQKSVQAGTPSASLGDSVAKKPVPKGVIPADAVLDLGTIRGRVASVGLQPGEQLLSSRFVDVNSLHAPGRVDAPAGMQEVTIKLPIERVVGGALSAGDTVGVLLSVQSGDNAPAQTQFTFNKVLVTGIQVSSGANAQNNATAAPTQSAGGLGGGANGPGSEYLITLARPAADAARIVYAAEFGKIYLTKEPGAATDGDAGVLDRTKVLR